MNDEGLQKVFNCTTPEKKKKLRYHLMKVVVPFPAESPPRDLQITANK